MESVFANEELLLVASPVIFFELHAVLSRLRPHISLPKEVGATAGVNTLVEFILEDCHLRTAPYMFVRVIVTVGASLARVTDS